MIKYFCDYCGDEITDTNKAFGGTTCDARLGVGMKVKGKKLDLELIVGDDAGSSSVDLCKYCILDAFKKLDDRPQAI